MCESPDPGIFSTLFSIIFTLAGGDDTERMERFSLFFSREGENHALERWGLSNKAFCAQSLLKDLFPASTGQPQKGSKT